MPRAGGGFCYSLCGTDRDASHPVENYQRLREEGFLALTIGKEWGGQGASLLDLAGISTGVARCFGAGVTSTVS